MNRTVKNGGMHSLFLKYRDAKYEILFAAIKLKMYCSFSKTLWAKDRFVF